MVCLIDYRFLGTMFQKLNFSVQIPRRSLHCCEGKELFQPEEWIVSYLHNADGQLQRKDYCCACWEKVKKAGEGMEGVFWKSKQEAKKQKTVFSDEKALTLFRKLALTNEKNALVTVLAYYLERKKQLVRRGKMSVEGKSVILFEIQETEEVFSVALSPLSQDHKISLIEDLNFELLQ